MTRELFDAHLAVIERIVKRVSRRGGLRGADVEDFASEVRLALIEDDYARLQRADQGTSLAAYLTVVVRNLLADRRMREGGRWRPSKQARRLGEAAERIERLLRRDQRSIDEIVGLVQPFHPGLTGAEVEAIAATLPERPTRLRLVELGEGVSATAVAPERAEARVIDRERRQAAERTSRAVRAVLDRMPADDRALLRLHYGSGRTIAEISRRLGVPQRPLYRRLARVIARVRAAIGAASVEESTISDLIGSAPSALDFGLEPEAADKATAPDGQDP